MSIEKGLTQMSESIQTSIKKRLTQTSVGDQYRRVLEKGLTQTSESIRTSIEKRGVTQISESIQTSIEKS